jgi:hypothetical protein
MRRVYFLLLLFIVWGNLGSPVLAQPLPPATVPQPQPAPLAVARPHLALEQALQTLLLRNMPQPLVENNNGWGDQKEVVINTKLERQGPLRWKTVTEKGMRNDGHWQKVRVLPLEPDKTLKVGVASVRTPEKGKSLLDTEVHLDVRMIYEQQLWRNGKRLYAGETHARCRTHLKLTIELTDRIHFPPGSLLPDLAFRVRVMDANLGYSDLVCEHTLGVDGELAKVMGKAAHEIIKKIKPSMEADLLKKANEGIVKAADTKEVKVELGKFLK